MHPEDEAFDPLSFICGACFGAVIMGLILVFYAEATEAQEYISDNKYLRQEVPLDNPYTQGHGLTEFGIEPVTCGTERKPECQENEVSLAEFIEMSTGLNRLCELTSDAGIEADTDFMLMCGELDRLHNLNEHTGE